jgi:tripartite motif-containing protein 71
VIVGDIGNNRVQRFNGTSGACIDKIGSSGSGGGQFVQPMAIAPVGSGMFAVADATNRIQIFSAASSPPAFLGSFQVSSGLLPNYVPRGIAIAGDGSAVYATDRGNQRVLKLRLRSPYA